MVGPWTEVNGVRRVIRNIPSQQVTTYDSCPSQQSSITSRGLHMSPEVISSALRFIVTKVHTHTHAYITKTQRQRCIRPHPRPYSSHSKVVEPHFHITRVTSRGTALLSHVKRNSDISRTQLCSRGLENFRASFHAGSSCTRMPRRPVRRCVGAAFTLHL